jgi:hypothetical protein
MHAPEGEVTLFEGMGDALAAALFLFILFAVIVVAAVVWAIVNFRRRPRWTAKVLLLTVAAALLLITPLVWKNAVETRDSYPARFKAYQVELAEYYSENDCSQLFGCLFAPQPPDNPGVHVPLYVVLLGIGAVSLVAGLRVEASDR